MDNKIGEYISYLRKKKGLTQVQLANILNISDKTISKWERGEGLPDVSILKDLAVSLDTSVDSLLNGGPSKIMDLVKGLGAEEDFTLVKYVSISIVSFFLAFNGLKSTYMFLIGSFNSYLSYELNFSDFIIIFVVSFSFNTLSIVMYKYFKSKFCNTIERLDTFFESLMFSMWSLQYITIGFILLSFFFPWWYDRTLTPILIMVVWISYSYRLFNKLFKKNSSH